MPLPRFVQIHTLHSYPASLLNRDDSGAAKRLPYGDAVRTRISSQCLKRHWRCAEDAFALKRLDVPMAVRSREILRHIRDRLIESGLSAGSATSAAEGLRVAGLLGKGQDVEGEEALSSRHAVLLGHAEIDYLVKRCAELAERYSEPAELKSAVAHFIKDERANLAALRLGSGLESALFGRMVTSDLLASRDAAIYVAHAFTVHESQTESDYISAIDDLLHDAGQRATTGLFEAELTSGLYYGYVVVDVPQLVANLEGLSIQQWASATPEQRCLAGRVVSSLLRLVATVSPGAKRGSTAPFEWAQFMLVEAGDWQPRSLASAFHNALPLSQPSLRRAAIERLADEVGRMDVAYGAPLARRFLAIDDVSVPGAQRVTLSALGDWAQGVVTLAHAEV